MKRLITLCFSIILFYPIWVNAQTTPQIIGTLTWNLSPPITITTSFDSCDSCLHYSFNSITANITDNGNDMYSLVWKASLYTDLSTSPYSFESTTTPLIGSGGMTLHRSQYSGFMYATSLPEVIMSTNVPQTFPVISITISCLFDSKTLSGYCSTLSGSSTQATLVVN